MTTVVPRLTSFIIILLMVSAVASVLVNATGPKAGDPLSYTTGGGRVEIRRGTATEHVQPKDGGSCYGPVVPDDAAAEVQKIVIL